jgi:hypothetical protein
MPLPIVQAGALVTCTHAGPATPTVPSTRVFAGGAPVVTLLSPYAIVGCLLTPTGVFCASGMFTAGATRVFAEGVPLAVNPGMSTCIATANPLLVLASQLRALAS